MTLINRWCTHTQTHGCTHFLLHSVWWKCYLSIFQLNVLISLVAHGCLGKQQSQLQKAESIHLRDCQSVRQRAEASALPETHGCTIFSLSQFRCYYRHFHDVLIWALFCFSSQAAPNKSHVIMTTRHLFQFNNTNSILKWWLLPTKQDIPLFHCHKKGFPKHLLL